MEQLLQIGSVLLMGLSVNNQVIDVHNYFIKPPTC